MTFIGSNSKGQIDFTNPWKSKDIYVPHALENSLMMFDPQNYECLIPLNKGFFQGHFGLTRCILFHSFHSWKSMQLVRPKWPFKKPLFTWNQTFIVFRVPSLTFFIMNVEKIQSNLFIKYINLKLLNSTIASTIFFIKNLHTF